ncbi:hypothetical protein L1049_000020 [Liquidambar formosana]|uniref:DUF1308 domain-containing protein n=1 Tax=Liquidambar formosana TaxID=63359 RepID=A0AAP0R370_LIQFO
MKELAVDSRDEPTAKGKEETDALAVVEVAKNRCRAVIDRIVSLPLSKITDSCKRTLLRLAVSELSFLSRSSSNPSSSISVNIGHLEAVIHILQQPLIIGVSRVCKPIPLLPATGNGKKKDSFAKGVHVDIVCTLNRSPVWFIVSNRNPKYVSWNGSHGNKGLRVRIARVLSAAVSSLTLKPSSIILFFSKGLDDIVHKKLKDEFEASEFGAEFSHFDFDFSEELEGEWINVLTRSYRQARLFEIKVDLSMEEISVVECGIKDSLIRDAGPELAEEQTKIILADTFCSVISGMKICSPDVRDMEPAESGNLLGEDDLINFDTTALIALVSGISNGGTKELLAEPEGELRQRFKSNVEFVIAQVMSEIRSPILVELGDLIFGKRGIICGSVCSEFKELVSMCGGPNEKLRARELLKCLTVVPDNPSARMMGLPTTRTLALKNKVVFGTGDYWRAPTLTANMGFVRAVSQTGMSLSIIEHRPRALTGD